MQSAAIVQRFSKARIECNGLVVVTKGGVELSHGMIGFTSFVERLSGAGVNLYGPSRIRRRCLPVLLQNVNRGSVVVGLEQSWLRLDSPAEIVQGAISVSHSLSDEATKHIGWSKT